MRTIAHISDLHFGREDRRVAEALLEDLLSVAPTVVAVSGDLTQRARTREFLAAREFLDRLPSPLVVVPGNHDVPLYNVLRRFALPLERYRRHITHDLSPIYRDDELAVLGLNTARSLTFKDGRISLDQIGHVRKTLCALEPTVFKVVVTHHQFIPPPGSPGRHEIVGRARPALDALAECGVDLLLAGHLHMGYTGDVKAHHPSVARSIVVAQAGTAISTRGRGEPNSYNLIAVSDDAMEVRVRTFDAASGAGGFAESDAARYERRDGQWQPSAP